LQRDSGAFAALVHMRVPQEYRQKNPVKIPHPVLLIFSVPEMGRPTGIQINPLNACQSWSKIIEIKK
jgi:hypothetical protein